MKSPRYSLICLILTTDNYLIRAVESLFVTKVMTTFLLFTGGGRERQIGWVKAMNGFTEEF